MQLTLHTDYSLRMLLYLGTMESATIAEVAERFKISRHHLVKVAHHLSKLGYVTATRGRTGGLRLARPAEEITVGQVVRDMEPNFHLVECYNPATPRCVIMPGCLLKGVLVQAEQAFMGVLDACTLAELLRNKERLRELLEAPAAAPRTGPRRPVPTLPPA